MGANGCCSVNRGDCAWLTRVSVPCRSFAYLTIRDRLPTILTKVVDTIHRNKNKFFEEYGEVRVTPSRMTRHMSKPFPFNSCTCLLLVSTQEGIQAEKQTIGLLSKLRNELQTDKPVLALTDSLQDAESWNQYLQRHQGPHGDQDSVSWFQSPWLYVECYMYRRIQEAFWLKWEALTSVIGIYCCSINKNNIYYVLIPMHRSPSVMIVFLLFLQSSHQWLWLLQWGKDSELFWVSAGCNGLVYIFGECQQEHGRAF